MSRNTITITTEHGAKVRTVHSRRYFVVNERLVHVRVDIHFDENEHLVREHVRLDPPVLVAKVLKRTDSMVAALAELRRNPTGSAVYVTSVSDGKVTGRFLTRQEVEERAASEKQRKAFAARHNTTSRAV